MSTVNPCFWFEDLKSEDFKPQDDVRVGFQIEPERLKEIYEQAFIYDLLYRFAKEFDLDGDQNPNEKSTDTRIDLVKDRVVQFLAKKKQQTEKTNLVIETSQLPIWNQEELSILRKNLSKVKEESYGLKSQLAVANQELFTWKSKYEKLFEETKSLPEEKRSIEKVNERLYIRLMEVEKNYQLNYAESKSLEDAYNQTRLESQEARKQAQDLINKNAKLEYELRKCKQDLESIETSMNIKFREVLDSQRQEILAEMGSLAKKNESLVRDLDLERQEHQRTKKALEQLRTHFMCTNLSTAGEKKKSHCRIDDSRLQHL